MNHPISINKTAYSTARKEESWEREAPMKKATPAGVTSIAATKQAAAENAEDQKGDASSKKGKVMALVSSLIQAEEMQEACNAVQGLLRQHKKGKKYVFEKSVACGCFIPLKELLSSSSTRDVSAAVAFLEEMALNVDLVPYITISGILDLVDSSSSKTLISIQKLNASFYATPAAEMAFKDFKHLVATLVLAHGAVEREELVNKIYEEFKLQTIDPVNGAHFVIGAGTLSVLSSMLMNNEQHKVQARVSKLLVKCMKTQHLAVMIAHGGVIDGLSVAMKSSHVSTRKAAKEVINSMSQYGVSIEKVMARIMEDDSGSHAQENMNMLVEVKRKKERRKKKDGSAASLGGFSKHSEGDKEALTAAAQLKWKAIRLKMTQIGGDRVVQVVRDATRVLHAGLDPIDLGETCSLEIKEHHFASIMKDLEEKMEKVSEFAQMRYNQKGRGYVKATKRWPADLNEEALAHNAEKPYTVSYVTQQNMNYESKMVKQYVAGYDAECAFVLVIYVVCKNFQNCQLCHQGFNVTGRTFLISSE